MFLLFIRAPRRVMIRARANLTTLLRAASWRRMARRDGPALPIVLPVVRSGSGALGLRVSPETAPPAALEDAAGGGPRRRRLGRRGRLRGAVSVRTPARRKAALGRQ